ncbi:MAG: DUF3459 domain-containing protein [Anaerolineae bacterium]|nr:DUF3459 domain-containing protein [Anaerolineae bacterium]
MLDAVFNHMSAQSEWFRHYLAADPAFVGRFRSEEPATDLSQVTRPRATPLLTPFQRPDGSVVYVWTTFSADQVDLDFRDPTTLLSVLDALLFYVSQGARLIRLDAIAYLWKVAGTSSIHLPETHRVIQSMRAVLDAAAPGTLIITETNVPHAENIAYFGDGHNEAHLVYNFTLPPLLFYSLLAGDATKLREWINTLETPSPQTTFFNFTASHDGIGVRPVEGILSAQELQRLLDHVLALGGHVSYKANSDGSQSPYEINCSYVDAVNDPAAPQAEQVARFLLSQGVMLALAGVPAVYIHSLLGSHNDLAGMQQAGYPRAINRAVLDAKPLGAELATPGSFRAQVFERYRELIRIRRAQPAFHPNAAQAALDLGQAGVLALRRSAPQQTLLALFNFSGAPQQVELPGAGRDVLHQDERTGQQVDPAALWNVAGSPLISAPTRPEASPPISFSTSSTVTRLKSPKMPCLRHEAAMANSRARWRSSP